MPQQPNQLPPQQQQNALAATPFSPNTQQPANQAPVASQTPDINYSTIAETKHKAWYDQNQTSALNPDGINMGAAGHLAADRQHKVHPITGEDHMNPHGPETTRLGVFGRLGAIAVARLFPKLDLRMREGTFSKDATGEPKGSRINGRKGPRGSRRIV